MAENKILNEKEIVKKINELKISLLKQTQKRKDLKREIARLLTMKNSSENKEKMLKVDSSKDIGGKK